MIAKILFLANKGGGILYQQVLLRV